MSSVLLLQQCPVCLVRLNWIVFVMGAGGRIVGASWGVAARTYSILLSTLIKTGILKVILLIWSGGSTAHQHFVGFNVEI